MTIQEQIQIVEDNLNEYGQCNITLEEYNFLKDEIYSSGCLAGIELGRADAIDEYKNKIINSIKDMQFHTGKAWFDFDASIDRCVEKVEQIAEQMKEQSK